MKSESLWSDDELKAAVLAYMEMLEKNKKGESYTKQKYYRELASKYDRSVKSFEFRMQNISHVLLTMDREWLDGLAPAKNVGTNTANTIEKFIIEYEESMKSNGDIEFSLDLFKEDIKSSGLNFTKNTLVRFTASLLTKPFVILTGLSGSGKTKLAQAFVQWICQNKSQYSIIPVGADWTNREPLLGYPNALDSKEYVKPDSEALDRIIKANENPDLPYFLILDEMNLSHVERYFADFLSIMESKEGITLYSGEERKSSDGLAIPGEIKWPENLFIIGTVNIDETTYMFSPKVLDRANVIEFRISKAELELYLGSNRKINLSLLKGKGASMAADFVNLAKGNDYSIDDDQGLNEALVGFFAELKKSGAEFGYRSASEIRRFVGIARKLDPVWEFDSVIDAAIMQKLLPKLHGSRSKLVDVLEILARICLNNAKDINIRETYFDVFKKMELDLVADKNVKFPISLEKICRMHKNVVDNGFTSYAEA